AGSAGGGAAGDHQGPPPPDAAAAIGSDVAERSDLADVPDGPGAPTLPGGCGHLFCEDFEQGEIDPARWSAQMGGAGTLAVQQEIVAHGKYAFHVHGIGAAGDFAMIVSKDAPMALRGAGPLFGRAYVYANTNVGSHVELGFAGSTRDAAVAPLIDKTMNFNYMEFAEFASSWQLGFDLFDPAPDVAKGFVEEASYPPARDRYPAGTWSCIEWEFGDDPDSMILWVDGKQIDQFDVQHVDYTSTARTAGSVLNGKSSGIIGGYAFFGFGFHSYGGSTAVERYFDDIALDTKRVGCALEGASGG
ncbi:MAG TPA: hypothetical protein VHL80_17115, partial [Polyangia bacterium]|nr:hypothetical protein [Polyangia bacterium]